MQRISGDPFAWHEAADRTHCVEDLFTVKVLGHQVVQDDAELRQRAEAISLLLGELIFDKSNKIFNE